MNHSPNNGSGSSPSEPPRRKRPTTSGTTAVGSGGGGGSPKRVKEIAEGTPIPVVLTLGTIVKLMVPLIGLVSLGLAFYWQTRTHIDNPTIHLRSGERGTIETKEEARTSRKRIMRLIKTHVDLKMRQQRVEQKEQIQKVGEDLKQEQKQALRQILNEVKQTRRTINRRVVPAISD